MGKHDELRTMLAAFAEKFGPKNTMLATVSSVDEAAFTCDLTDDDANYKDVRLRPVLDGNESVTIFPKTGTWVLAIRIEEEESWMIVAVGEASKVRMIVDDCTYEIKDGFLVQKGSETLKKIMDDLLQGIEQLTVNTNVGPSSVPINVATFVAIKARIDNFLR